MSHFDQNSSIAILMVEETLTLCVTVINVYRLIYPYQIFKCSNIEIGIGLKTPILIGLYYIMRPVNRKIPTASSAW